MNLRALLAAAAVIIILPVIYLLLNIGADEEEYSFRGLTVRSIAPEQATIVVPSASENAAGQAMLAKFTPSYIETVTGWKTMNPKGLDLALTTANGKSATCNQDGSMPPTASFKLAQQCAQAEFVKMALPAPTVLFVSPEDALIVFGNKGDNRVRLYHDTVIATYSSPDMTQSERKTEACLVKMMISHLLNVEKVDASVCKPKPAQ